MQYFNSFTLNVLCENFKMNLSFLCSTPIFKGRVSRHGWVVQTPKTMYVI